MISPAGRAMAAATTAGAMTQQNPGRGRQTFQDYAEKVWLPNHEIEATTRQSYTYSIHKSDEPGA